MQEKGHTTFSFDLPGHGMSDFSGETKDLPQLVDQLIYENNLDNPIIVGHSSGGILAVDYATRTKNVSSLVLIGCPLSNPKYANPNLDWDGGYEMYKKMSSDKFQEQKFIDFMAFSTEDEISEVKMKVTDPRGFSNNVDFYSKLDDNKEIYELDVPILYLASQEDHLFSTDYAKDCVEKMRNGKLETVPGGHNVLITHPERILGIIEENYSFLNTL